MPKVFDCFLFAGELALYRLRQAELSRVVDEFVAVESAETLQGRPRALTDLQALHNGAADSLVRVVAELPQTNDPWAREYAQRDYVLRYLKDRVSDDDLVILGDADEIPRPEVIAQLRNEGPAHGEVVALETPVFYYSLNKRLDANSYASRVVRASTLSDLTPTQVRVVRPSRTIEKAGWHFSNLAPYSELLPFMLSKATSYTHAELNRKRYLGRRYLSYCFEHGFQWSDYVPFSTRLLDVQLDESFPRAVFSNPQLWSEFFHPGKCSCSPICVAPALHRVARVVDNLLFPLRNHYVSFKRNILKIKAPPRSASPRDFQ